MRRTPKKAKATRAPARAVRQARQPRSSSAVTKRLATVTLFCATFVAIAHGVHWLKPYARAALGGDQWRLEWVDLPATIDQWIQDDVLNETRLYDLHPLLETDIHDPQLCERLGLALEQSPWIARVERVSKGPDGVVRVQARFREYLTYVVRDGMGYLVDEAGVRLPRQEAKAFLPEYELILVEGVAADVPPLGEPWNSDDVVAGLQLVQYLEANCPPGLRGSLKAVDVANYQDRLNRRDGWLRLRTVHPGRYILWGLPPEEEYDIESSAERKLEVLWSLYQEYGQLPDLKDIDVRDATGFLHKVTP